MGEHTTRSCSDLHCAPRLPFSRTSPPKDDTARLRLLDDFKRAAELSSSDPFPSDQPATPLERTIAKAFHSQSPKDSQRRKTLHIKHPERVTADSSPFDEGNDDSSSTDSWSGDEEFLEQPSEKSAAYPEIGPSLPMPRSSRFYAPASVLAPMLEHDEE